MAHQCTALVFPCIDFRLPSELVGFLEEQGLLGDCDWSSLAGSAKSIINNEDGPTALRQIGLARELHGIEKVLLVNHTDCGAYGGSAAFDSPEAERRQHLLDMEKAAELIKAQFSGLTVELWLAVIEDKGSEVKFEKLG